MQKFFSRVSTFLRILPLVALALPHLCPTIVRADEPTLINFDDLPPAIEPTIYYLKGVWITGQGEEPPHVVSAGSSFAPNYKASSSPNILMASQTDYYPSTYSIGLAFDHPASSASFNIEIPYGAIVYVDVVDPSLQLVSRQILFSANSSKTNFELFPVTFNSPSGIYVIDIYYNDFNWSGAFAIDDLKFTPYSPNFDLKVDQPIVAQSQATASPSGTPLQVTPGVPVQITVPISGSGFNNPENRETSVTLQAGPYKLPAQLVSLEKMRLGEVNKATFNVTFSSKDIGLQTITATIDPGNALNESDPSNNTKSVQVNVDSGPKFQLAADFPDLANDPSYNQKLSGTTQSMQVPLGAKFNLQLNQLDASGNSTKLNSQYSMKSQNTSPAISKLDGPTLFPNNVLVENNDSLPGEQKLFQAFHMGNATIQITPTDPTYSSQSVTVNVTVYDPGIVGQSEPTPDDLIVKYAHKRGLPPQLIKAQIRQEGFVKSIDSISETAFKYEPGYDSSYVQYSTKWHPTAIVEDPKYMPAELRLDSNDNSLRQSILWQTDIDPRSMYDMTDPATKTDPDPAPRTITPSDVGITAANYINSNGSFPDSLFDDDDFEFTAQTTVASSYGLLQVMYLTAVDEKWNSPSGDRHPSELFIPNENISIGTRHLVRQVKFPFDDKSPSRILLQQISISFDKALNKYNGGRILDYFSLVDGFVPQYTPNNVKPVFTSGQ